MDNQVVLLAKSRSAWVTSISTPFMYTGWHHNKGHMYAVYCVYVSSIYKLYTGIYLSEMGGLALVFFCVESSSAINDGNSFIEISIYFVLS